MAVSADSRQVNIDLVKAVGATDWENAYVTARLLTSIATSGSEVMPLTGDVSSGALDANGEGSLTLVTPPDDGTAFRYLFKIYDPNDVLLVHFEANISYGGTTTLASIIGAANLDSSDNANTLTSLIDAHAALSDPHTGYLQEANNLSDLNSASTARTNLGLGTAATSAATDFVAVIGDAMTGPLTITTTSSNGSGTYPFVINVTPDNNTFPSPALLLRNPSDGTGANRFDGEVHLWFRAGATRNERRYINWRTYDNSSDDWIMGANASDDFILYDGLVHRFWFPNGVSGNNYTAISATGTGRVRLNYHPSDTTGSGGVAFHSGAANGNSYFTAVLSTPYDLTGNAYIYLDVDGSYYHSWRSRNGAQQYWLTGKGTVNQYRIYNDVLARDAISIASATNAMTFGGNVSAGGYEFANYGENVASASISSGAITLNAQAANVFTVSLTENITSAPSITWPANANYCSIEVIYTQDATGGRTVTHTGMVGSDSGTAPDISTTANAVSRVVYSTPDGGTTEYADLIGKDYASI